MPPSAEPTSKCQYAMSPVKTSHAMPPPTSARPARPQAISVRLSRRSTIAPAAGDATAMVPPCTKPTSPTALRSGVSDVTSHCMARPSTWKQTNWSRFEVQSRP